MDRNLRAARNASTGRSHWARALTVTLAVAGTCMALGASTVPAVAQEASGKSMSVPLAPDAPDTYVVKKGDTLWDIAGVFLKYPWYWPEIWYVNPQVANPHWIYPGDVLHLVYINGQPRITVGAAGEVRLSPEVRTSPLSQAIRTVPYDVLMNFVKHPSVLTEKQVEKSPYVLGFRDHHIIGTNHIEFYAKGLGDPAPGSTYAVVHPGQPLRDPKDGKLLGYVGYFAGNAEVITNTNAKDKDDSIAHLRVIEGGREIQQGDKLLPAVSNVGDDFPISTPTNRKLDGQVLAVLDQIEVGGQYQVLAMNLGKRDGLVPGSVLGILRRGTDTPNYYSRGQDWTTYTANYETVALPNERSASVLVFEVKDRVSYGLVVQSTQAIFVGDLVKHPDVGHDEAGMQPFIR